MTQLREPVVAANWKMHMTPSQTREYVRSFAARWDGDDHLTVAFFPPAVSLPAFLEARDDRDDLIAGVQDVHQEEEGAHTGAISARMAQDAGAAWGLAGHSERRHEFGDTPEQVARKARRLAEAGLRPVLCVGETLEEREAGELERVLARQAEPVLEELDPAVAGSLIYAYEPVWAIGTGETASPEDAGEAHALLRSHIGARMGGEVARRASILYGGSVKPHNAAELLSVEGIDGVLVGSASLEPESFAEICRAAV